MSEQDGVKTLGQVARDAFLWQTWPLQRDPWELAVEAVLEAAGVPQLLAAAKNACGPMDCSLESAIARTEAACRAK